MDQLGEKAEADDETILNQSGSAEDNTTETGSSGLFGCDYQRTVLPFRSFKT
jgi:hypothetical protein